MRRPGPLALLLLLAPACFRPAISKLPRDRGPLPAPTWSWNPEKGELLELPLPPGARWLREEQEKRRRELTGGLAHGETLLLALYEVDSPRGEVERFYAGLYETPTQQPAGATTIFRSSGLLPDLSLTGERPVRIEAVKRLPAGVAPPDQAPVSVRR